MAKKSRVAFTSEPSEQIYTRIQDVLRQKPSEKPGNLKHVVREFLKRREKFLSLAGQYSTPFYVLDDEKLTESIQTFAASFHESIPQCKVYYAMKTNHHAYILQTVVKHGFGIDISSTREFDLAMQSGCKDFIFTGPGKSLNDLEYVLQKDPSCMIHIDSFAELEKVGVLGQKLQRNITAGIRIYTSAQLGWSKFGIPLQELRTFYDRAKQLDFVDLCAIQFHLSWNANAKPYDRAIQELAIYLTKMFTKEERQHIRYIDFGGGFRPSGTEGSYPWALTQGEIIKLANEYTGQKTQFMEKYYIPEVIPIRTFAQHIGSAIRTYLSPIVDCVYYTEPGRAISNSAMHIVLKVIDVKDRHRVIMDGGINIVGWDRFEYEYFPIINVSAPSVREHECMVYGPLCMPEDYWGRYYYGNGLHEGDICVVPHQGCLTYSLAQNFIRPIPDVHILT